MACGIEALEQCNPLACAAFVTTGDVWGLPPVIRVNECDPLREEGIGFYRLLLGSGVPARCRQLMDTIHGIEILPVVGPDIAGSTALDTAEFVRNTS